MRLVTFVIAHRLETFQILTTFYLIRHGTNDFLGRRLAGRFPGVHLNEEGRGQAARVSEQLCSAGITHIFSSPLERALETAQPLAQKLGLKIQVNESIHEVQFGEWNGKTLVELDLDPRWQKWNESRSGLRLPNGETIMEVQTRVVEFLKGAQNRFPNQNIAVFSHGDPIRAALVYFLGAPIDHLVRLEADPASISILTLTESEARVLAINR